MQYISLVKKFQLHGFLAVTSSDVKKDIFCDSQKDHEEEVFSPRKYIAFRLRMH